MGPNAASDLLGCLRLEGEAGANFVGGLIELLGVDRGAEAEGDTLAEEDVVGEGNDAAVIKLDLQRERHISNTRSETNKRHQLRTLANDTGSMRYLPANSIPTLLPVLEFHTALQPPSTWLLTFW